MKYIKTFESSSQKMKYLIYLSSTNSGSIMDLSNPTPEQIQHAEKNWSLKLNLLHNIEIPRSYQDLPNDILTKLVGCRNDVERSGPAFLTDLAGLSINQISRFRYEVATTETEYTSRYWMKLSDTLKRFKDLTLDQKLIFFDELENSDYLVIRNTYIYKVLDESEIVDEVMDITNKFDLISKEVI